MNSRLAKQIIYGAGYLATLFLIIFVVYLIWFKPTPTCFDNRQNQNETDIDCGGFCPACEIRTLKVIETSWIKYFSVDDKTAIVAEIKNSNLNWMISIVDLSTILFFTISNELITLPKINFLRYNL